MINDPNELIARLYPVNAGSGGGGGGGTGQNLTILQPNGQSAVYNGSAEVTADARPKTLTINNSDGTTTTYNGSANKTVTFPSALPPTPGSVDNNALANNSLSLDKFTAEDKLRWMFVAEAANYVGSFSDNVVNVKNMGAQGDGVTDDTNALIDAFQSIAATGGIVYFPPGEYVIGGGGAEKYVEFYSNMRIVGVPGKSVLIYADSLADHGTSWEKPKSLLRNHTTNTEGRYTSTHDVIIDGLVFDGNPRIPKSSTALGIGHANNITVRNCIFRNHYSLIPNSHYVEINASRHVIVDGCIFEPEYHYANNISDKSKWDCIYAEYINLDRASENSYGAPGYYVWDNTEPDEIEILNNKFMSFPSDYWSHPRQLDPAEVYWTSPAVNPSRTAANVFYGLAIGGHADYGKDYPGNRGEAGTNVKIHDNLFLGDWNSSVITSGTTQPARRYTINVTNQAGECDGWVIKNNVFIAANKNASSESTNRKACGINLNTAKIHNYIYDNTFLYYDADELLYHGAGYPTSSTAKYWNIVNMAEDGTTTVKGNLPSPTA